MADYLPHGVAELLAFAKNMHEKISVAPTTYGLTATDMVKLDNAKHEFKTAFDDHTVKLILLRREIVFAGENSKGFSKLKIHTDFNYFKPFSKTAS